MTNETEESPMISWAEKELRLAGLYDEDSDYGGMLADAVMKLIREFCDEGHSGSSAHMTADIFDRLVRYKPLTQLTDDPDEWMHIAEDVAGEPNLCQSKRSGSCFSFDDGKTFYDIDEKMSFWRRRWARITSYKRAVKMYKSVSA